MTQPVEDSSAVDLYHSALQVDVPEGTYVIEQTRVARAGIDTASLHPPAGGRAPGWHAGLAIARRGDG